MKRQNQYLDHLIGQVFHGVNRPFVLSFEDNNVRISYKRDFLPTVEIKDNFMIDGQNFFWLASKKRFKNIWRMITLEKL